MCKNVKSYYIFIGKQKVLVSKDIYKSYQRIRNREKYLKRLDRINGLVFFSSYDYLGDNFIDTVVDDTADVERLVLLSIKIEKLKDTLKQLSEDEQQLIILLFYEEKSLREIANIRGVHHSTILREKRKILKKLKEML